MKEMLNVGQIINTHGVIGAIKVHPLTDDMYRFDDLEYVYIDGAKFYIEDIKYLKEKVVLKLQGINSMNEAEKYKTKYLQITRDQAVELEEDTYFVSDLIGCIVVDTNGFEYGKVDEVIQTGSNDVYWVKGNKEILVPVLKDIVIDIDVDNKKITMKPAGEWQDED